MVTEGDTGAECYGGIKRMKTPQIYLGWDPREAEAYRVARSSIIKRCNKPMSIIPLDIRHIDCLDRTIEERDGMMWDPISQAPMSTEFAISRFAIPFIQKSGWALFADCDILCWSDITELFALADDKYAVMVVKHRHESGPEIKMDGQAQNYYARKNWSSVVLWNCEHKAHQHFDEAALNGLPGRDLHAFCWLNDRDIGELPQKWNWLINVTPGEPEKTGIWHYTLGGPWFDDWAGGSYDQQWSDALSVLDAV